MGSFQPIVDIARSAMAVIVIGLVGVIFFGIFPDPVLQFASDIPISFGFTVP